VNHVATCNRCRTALAREEQIARDLWRELPVIGRETPDPVGAIWSGVWQEIARPRLRTRWLASVLLPGVSIALAIVLAVAAVLPLLAEDGLRAEAAPLQPRPISTASPTPGAGRWPPAATGNGGDGLAGWCKPCPDADGDRFTGGTRRCLALRTGGGPDGARHVASWRHRPEACCIVECREPIVTGERSLLAG